MLRQLGPDRTVVDRRDARADRAAAALHRRRPALRVARRAPGRGPTLLRRGRRLSTDRSAGRAPAESTPPAPQRRPGLARRRTRSGPGSATSPRRVAPRRSVTRWTASTTAWPTAVVTARMTSRGSGSTRCRRFVTIVPEIDLPGHAQAVIAAYPDLGNVDGRSRCGPAGGSASTCSTSARAPWRSPRTVVRYVAGRFPGSPVHIGGDECPTTEWEHSELGPGGDGRARTRATSASCKVSSPSRLAGGPTRRRSRGPRVGRGDGRRRR